MIKENTLSQHKEASVTTQWELSCAETVVQNLAEDWLEMLSGITPNSFTGNTLLLGRQFSFRRFRLMQRWNCLFNKSLLIYHHRVIMYETELLSFNQRLWSRSPNNFGWLELEPSQKLLSGGAKTGTWNLGSGYTVLVCGASVLYI